MTLFAIIHLCIAVILIFFVLIQDSKGGGMGMMGGGGSSNSVLGATGAASFLVKVTRWLAICFAASCIFLAYQTSKKTDSIMDEYSAPGAQTGSLSVDSDKSDKKEEDKAKKDDPDSSPSTEKMDQDSKATGAKDEPSSTPPPKKDSAE